MSINELNAMQSNTFTTIDNSSTFKDGKSARGSFKFEEKIIIFI